MNAPEKIDFTVGALRFVGIDMPSEDSLAMYAAPNEGNRNPCLATIIPPGPVEWTNEALKKWVEEDFLPMASKAELSEYDPLVERLVEVAKEAILDSEPNGRPSLTVDEEESFDRRTRVAVMAILNHVVFAVPRGEEPETEAPERAKLCQCGHQRQAHHDGETTECRYAYGADQAVCPCMGFEPA